MHWDMDSPGMGVSERTPGGATADYHLNGGGDGVVRARPLGVRRATL